MARGAVVSGHTPGPWGYCYDGSSDWSIGEASDPQGKFVANIWDKDDVRAAANARLIAAAPDLLAALKDLREAVKTVPEMNHIRFDALGIKVNNAIARAETK